MYRRRPPCPPNSPLGRDSATADWRKESRAPSTRHPSSLKWFSRSWKSLWRDSTLGFPRITRPLLARVMATFNRRGSFKKPMPVFSLLRTQERMMKSFSRPWNASTDATSTSPYSLVANTPARVMCCDTYARWPSYGVTTPMRPGSTPARSKCVTTFSTPDASARLRYEVPDADISSAPVMDQNIIGDVGLGQGKSTCVSSLSAAATPFCSAPS
mmetsp:Transcript_9771/g.39609  ORF Transcript_9771/g.39609 Transcript_9771/m.39609 type:complete len:214 (+) Transcript_9771:339-980(+)